MRTISKFKAEESVPKPSYIQKLPKKKILKERQKIRQLLRSMLTMGEDQRQHQEEQDFYHNATGLTNWMRIINATSKTSHRKPQLISVSPESSKDVFSSTKISLLVATRNEGAAELAPSGNPKRSM